MRKSIYIAGPMTGIPEFNFPAFYAAAAKFRRKGYVVNNPAEKDEEVDLDKRAVKNGDAALAIKKGFDFREAYLWDLSKVVTGDGIYMLKGWERSAGARGEHAAAVAMKQNYPDYEIIYEG